jgi:hypothetical protein
MGGTASKGENRNTQSNISPPATLSTTNPTQPGLGSNANLRDDGPATSHMKYVAVNLNTEISLNCVQRFSPYREVNTLCIGYKNQSVNIV